MDFVPSATRWVSQLGEPWNNPDGKVPLQEIHNAVYRTVDGIVDHQHPLVDPVSHFTFPPLYLASLTFSTSQLKSKLIGWRVGIGRRAEKLVTEHLADQTNMTPASSLCEYVGWRKPEPSSTGEVDAPFTFSNRLKYKAALVHFLHTSSD